MGDGRLLLCETSLGVKCQPFPNLSSHNNWEPRLLFKGSVCFSYPTFVIMVPLPKPMLYLNADHHKFSLFRSRNKSCISKNLGKYHGALPNI